MIMKTATATKTAVTWMVAGGAVVLAASFLLGNSFGFKAVNPSAVNPTNVSQTNQDNIIQQKKAQGINGGKICTGGNPECIGKESGGGRICGDIITNMGYNTCEAIWSKGSDVICTCTGGFISPSQ